MVPLLETFESRLHLSTARFNFQPSSAPAVSGYIVDSGVAYGAKSGQTFGWSVNHTDAVFDRNKNNDQRLDTHVAFKSASRWELGVPNGSYTVTVTVGDSAASSKNNIWIEGVQLFNYQSQAANVFSTKSLSVNVTDGRLTMAIGQAATGTVRVNSIEVAGLPDVPPTVPPPPTSPPPTSPPPTVPPPPTSTNTVRFNFQPSNVPAVSGYILDSGVTYGAKSGQTFGWSVNHTDAVFDRNKNNDQRLDTHVAFKSASRWELGVPNGSYTVTVTVGDSAASSKNNIWIEGVQLFNYQSQAANVFSTKSLSVNVTDGRLTMAIGQAATGTVRVNSIEVVGLPVVPPPPIPPAPPPPPPIPAPRRLRPRRSPPCSRPPILTSKADRFHHRTSGNLPNCACAPALPASRPSEPGFGSTCLARPSLARRRSNSSEVLTARSHL